MKFTDRYIWLPTKMIIGADADKAERMGIDDKQEMQDSWIKVIPTSIENYGPDFNIETGHQDHTGVRTKSGDTFKVPMDVKEFERLLNDFDQ